MPYAVTHILIPIITLDLIRDHYMKHKHAWTNKYLFAAGVGGILPDVINVLVILQGLITGVTPIFRPYTHNLLFLLIFVFAAEIFRRKKSDHKYALALGFGVGMHLLLDLFILGGANLFYPFSSYLFAINLFDIIPIGIRGLLGMDVAVLLLWLLHEEKEHKITNFV